MSKPLKENATYRISIFNPNEGGMMPQVRVWKLAVEDGNPTGWADTKEVYFLKPGNEYVVYTDEYEGEEYEVLEGDAMIDELKNGKGPLKI